MGIHPDHASTAEANARPDERALRRYRWYFWSGIAGLLVEALAIVALVLGWIPDQGYATIGTIVFILVTLPVSVVLLITGQGKGRDHRPSVMEMFGAGGRR